MKETMLKPALRWALGFVLVTALAGCVTSKEVKDIVDASNAAVIQVSLFPDHAPLNGDGEIEPDKDLESMANRVAIFAEAYPDRPRTINPLRLRLAWAYLNAGKWNSASAVYQSVNGEYLTFETQVIIYKHFDDFVWWFAAANRSWSGDDVKEADRVRNALMKTAGEEGRTNYLRAWLNYTAAKIGIMLAATKREADFKTITETVLAEYRASFTEEEQEQARNTGRGTTSEADKPDDKTMLRWYLVVPAVYEEANDNWEEVFNEHLPITVTGDWIICGDPISGGNCIFSP
jgi:hypothetical protein